MTNQFIIDLNPLTIHNAIEALDGIDEYPVFRDSIEEMVRAHRAGDDAAMLENAKELAAVIESVLHDPAFISGWKDSADLLIAAA